jgi:hypothetical protein
VNAAPADGGEGRPEERERPSSTTVEPCTSAAAWDAFVAASPQGSVFCKSWFLAALGVESERWLLRVGGRALAGALVLRRDGAVVPAPHPFTMYQGVLLAPEVAVWPAHRAGKGIVDLTTALLDGLTARYPSLSFCLHPSFTDVRGLQWYRYGRPDAVRLDVRFTGVLPLAGLGDLDGYLAAIRTTRRYEHRRAQSRQLAVEASDDIDTLDRLHRATFERQGLDRAEAEARLLRAITTAALDANAGELLIGRTPAGEAASATLFVRDDHTSYYLFGANAPALRALNAGTLLVVEGVRRALERGLSRVDFCGVNSPNRGDFKTSLGGVVTPYFVAHLPEESSR